MAMLFTIVNNLGDLGYRFSSRFHVFCIGHDCFTLTSSLGDLGYLGYAFSSRRETRRTV